MNTCPLVDSADVEMYFYGELDPVDRVRVEQHLRGCEPCRQRLDDLHAIRRALATRPVDRRAARRRLVRVHAPPRLGRRADRAEPVEPSNLRTSNPRTRNPGTREP